MLITYIRQDRNNFKNALGQKCAELYCRIWKEPPWCEDFWQPNDVLNTLKKELDKPAAACWLAITQTQEILGFTWGYGVNRYDLRKIAGNNQINYLFKDNKKVFYIDELGVDNKKRQKGLGKTLTIKLIDHAISHDYGKIALRTDIKAIPARIVYQRLGFKELDIKDANHPTRSYWLLRP